MKNSTPADESGAKDQLRVCKFMAGAFMALASAALAIFGFMRYNGDKGLVANDPWDILARPNSVLALDSLVGGIVMVLLIPVVSNMATKRLRARMAAGIPIKRSGSGINRSGELRFMYERKMSGEFFLYQGAAVLNAVAFLLQGRLPNVVAVLVLLGLMVSRFPNRASMDAFVEKQSELLRAQRQPA